MKKNYKTGLTARRPFSGSLPRDLLPSYCRISGLTADLLPIGALLRYSVVGCPSRFSISRTEAVVLRVNQDAFNAGPKAMSRQWPMRVANVCVFVFVCVCVCAGVLVLCSCAGVEEPLDD